MIKGIVIGVLLAIVIGVGGVTYYFTSGMAPAAAGDPPMPFEKKLANMSLDAHIKAQNIGQPPIPADEPNLVAGADLYAKNCASCHGLPNQPPSPYEKAMFPKPTALFRGKGVTDDPPSESFWKVENGIRLSGMPSFKKQLTDTQMWQVALVVAHANELPDSAKAKLVPVETAATAGLSANQKPASK